MSFIEFENVYRRYQTGEIIIPAVDGVSFSIEKGEFCLIVGTSGAGKSTVLNILGGMDSCDDGKVRVAGKPITDLSKSELVDYRRYEVGFIFQFYNLVPNLTALENVELATQMCKKPVKPEEILARVGLKERLEQLFHNRTGAEIHIQEKINPEIMGGFIFEMDGYMLDASVENQFRRIRRQLIDKNNRIV